MAKERELSGETVIAAEIYFDAFVGHWYYVLVTKERHRQSPGFDTPLAAARTLVNELQNHSREF